MTPAPGPTTGPGRTDGAAPSGARLLGSPGAGRSTLVGMFGVVLVCTCLVIGTLELVGLPASRLGATSGPLTAIGGADLGSVGYVVVGLFVITWLTAALVRRLGRIEERWTVASGAPR